jgi:hypothetical protein
MNNLLPVYRETDPEVIRLLLLRFCYLLHPTCMARHSLIKKYSLYYDENLTYASDYAWQVKASSLFPISNINEILLLYRKHDNQISAKYAYKQGKFAHSIMLQQLAALGLKTDDREKNILIDFLVHKMIKEEDVTFIKNFTGEIIALNRVKRYYHQERLTAMLNLLLENCMNQLIK